MYSNMFKTINGWTKAEMIEVIKNRPNYICSNESNCLYRDNRGGACAIGAFIPDDLYDPCIERKGAIGIAETYEGLHFPLKPAVLATFQSVHDKALGGDINAILIKWIEDNVE